MRVQELAMVGSCYHPGPEEVKVWNRLSEAWGKVGGLEKGSVSGNANK